VHLEGVSNIRSGIIQTISFKLSQNGDFLPIYNIGQIRVKIYIR
jgi:hypothetical protein